MATSVSPGLSLTSANSTGFGENVQIRDLSEPLLFAYAIIIMVLFPRCGSNVVFFCFVFFVLFCF